MIASVTVAGWSLEIIAHLNARDVYNGKVSMFGGTGCDAGTGAQVKYVDATQGSR